MKLEPPKDAERIIKLARPHHVELGLFVPDTTERDPIPMIPPDWFRKTDRRITSGWIVLLFLVAGFIGAAIMIWVYGVVVHV